MNNTFYKHEIHSLIIYQKCMKSWSLKPSNTVSKLIKASGVRFYTDTKIRTYRNFLLELGKNNLHKFLDLLLVDRKGNDKNKDKPLETKEFKRMKSILLELDKNQIYIEDIKFPSGYIPWKYKRELAALIQLNSQNNNIQYLINKIKKWKQNEK